MILFVARGLLDVKDVCIAMVVEAMIAGGAQKKLPDGAESARVTPEA